jgi:hypothetical protein
MAGSITAWQTAAANWRTAVNGFVNASVGSVGLVCVHRFRKAGATPTNPRGQLPTPFVDFLGVPSVDTRICSQRRRTGRSR